MVSSISYQNGHRSTSLEIIPTGGKKSLPDSPLFGTDGIRGKAGELLTASLALDLGYWAGQILKNESSERNTVIIGQDSRNSSDMLAGAIGAGLTAAGVEVWQLGLCPTPCVAHLTKESGAIGGIMISASHNPPEDNGIKFFDGRGLKLASPRTDAIEAGLRSNREHRPGKWGKSYHRPELIQKYYESIVDSIDGDKNLEGMKIVLDLAWGASVKIAPEVFKAVGAEVICLHDRPDGDRINVNCGSTHLETLKASVIEHKADLGFAFDGDADRVMAVDGQGRTVDGDYILYFWGKSLLEKGRLPDRLLIATVMANLGFERAWRKLGGELIRTAVGDRYVQEKMWLTGAMLGGEQSGHILCHHYGVSGDGVQTALHISHLVRRSGKTLTELVDNSFVTYPQILRNVRVDDREKRLNWKECGALQKEIERAEIAMGDTGRILVRASGTEPLIRVMVEADSYESAEYWTRQLTETARVHLT